MSKRKIENTNYTKDTKTGVIVNDNNAEYLNARSRRSRQKRDSKKVQDLRNELNEMKSLMAELSQTVKDLNNGNK